MCGGFTCSKNSLIALNVFYIVVAITLISVAAYAKLASIVTSISLVSGIIACGVFLLFVSIIGIIAARKHHQVMLFFYMVILFLIFIIQFSVACACLAFNKQHQYALAFKGWSMADDSLKLRAEQNFHCCGYDDTVSENRTCSEVKGTNDEFCCPKDDPQCCSTVKLANADENAVSSCKCPTCKDKLQKVIEHGLSSVGGIGLVFSFTEIIGFVLARRYRHQINPELLNQALLIS